MPASCVLNIDEKEASAQEDLTVVIDGENSFTFRTAETSRFAGFQFFRADRAFEYFREDLSGTCVPLLFEERNRFIQAVFDVEKLGKPEKLENFVNLRLDFEKDQIPASGLDSFEKGGKGSDTGTGNVIQASAVKNQLGKSCFNGSIDPFLEIVGIVGVDVSGQIEGEAVVYRFKALQPDLEAVILFIVEASYNLVVVHSRPSLDSRLGVRL